MFRTRFLVAASALVLLSGAAPAIAQAPQPEPPIRRLDRLDRAVRELNAIVRQGAATGRPVIVAPETLPSDLDALRQRMDDFDAALRTQTSTIESLTGDLNTARRTAAEAQAQVRDLQTRIATLESAQAQAALAPPAPAAAAEAPAPAPAAAGRPADPAAAFQKARQQLLEGDYASASAGFEDYATRFPNDARTPEARYWLGETLYIRENYSAAAQAYIAALRGWPKSNWAPDALVKLSTALIELKQTDRACQTLAEFDRRYASAPAAAKTRAATARTRAKCA